MHTRAEDSMQAQKEAVDLQLTFVEKTQLWRCYACDAFSRSTRRHASKQ